MGICNRLKDLTIGSPYEVLMDWSYFVVALIPAASGSLGIFPVLTIVVAEIFPTDIRSIAVGIVMAMSYLAAYCSMMTYPIVSGADAFHELMFVYGAISVFMTVWAIFTLKETDHMSLVEIERMFKGVRNSFRRVRNSFRRSGRRPRGNTADSGHASMTFPSIPPSLPSLPESTPLITTDTYTDRLRK